MAKAPPKRDPSLPADGWPAALPAAAFLSDRNLFFSWMTRSLMADKAVILGRYVVFAVTSMSPPLVMSSPATVTVVAYPLMNTPVAAPTWKSSPGEASLASFFLSASSALPLILAARSLNRFLALDVNAFVFFVTAALMGLACSMTLSLTTPAASVGIVRAVSSSVLPRKA